MRQASVCSAQARAKARAWSTAGMSIAVLPVVIGCFGKAGHRFFHVLLGNLALGFANKVNDPLVRFQIFVPRRSRLTAGRDSHPHEGKERHKKAATLLDDKWIA